MRTGVDSGSVGRPAARLRGALRSMRRLLEL